MDIIGLIFIWAGVASCALGVVGIIRFKSVYNRLHAGGLISTLGLTLLAVGVALLMPEQALKLIVLAGFVIVTAPVASQSVAAAARAANDEKMSVTNVETSTAPQSE